MPEAFYYVAGIGFLALAKLKHMLRGYQTPKPFGDADLGRCIEYDLNIGRLFVESYREYTGRSIEGLRILELGPGSDLGLGCYLLSLGAASYTALDRNPLAVMVTDSFYNAFCDRAGISRSLAAKLQYVADPAFDVGKLGPVDLVISNAAFEHFDDPAQVIRSMRQIISPGGTALLFVDLKTHSRWIRDKDPHNIYRYPEWLYRLFYFPGQPNRKRPADYRQMFANWNNVLLKAMTKSLVPQGIARRFGTDEMSWTSMAVWAHV
jgi:SAM-dependent methyltransferase